MPEIDEKKLEVYVKKVYNGELKRYKEKEKNDSLNLLSFYDKEQKIKRKPIGRSLEKTVIENFKRKCAICSKEYDEDDFEIHHIDGNRSNTYESNLALLCHRCHKKVHRLVRSKLMSYKVKNEKKSQSGRKKGRKKDLLDVSFSKDDFF